MIIAMVVNGFMILRYFLERLSIFFVCYVLYAIVFKNYITGASFRKIFFRHISKGSLFPLMKQLAVHVCIGSTRELYFLAMRSSNKRHSATEATE